MTIVETQHVTYTSLRPIGELDANSSIYMDEKIGTMIPDGRVNVHIDCSDLTYISSAGLGVFISYLDDIQKLKGMFVFSDMRDSVRDVFDLLGLTTLVPIVATHKEAANLFEK